MVLVSATLIFSVAETQTTFARASEDRKDCAVTPLLAANFANVYERQGASAVYLRYPPPPYTSLYFLGEDGLEISGRVLPPAVHEIAQRAKDSGQTQITATREGRLLGQSVMGPSGRHYVLVLQTPAHPFADFLYARPVIQVMRIAAVLLVAGFVCFWLAHEITAPVRRLSAVARQLAGGNLAARVGEGSIRRHDEIADLARDFNYMAAQVESSMSDQRRLIGDISHELRSPLARLGVALGIARRHANAGSIAALDRMQLEIERLNELIGNLLKLARLESGVEPMKRSPVNLDSLTREVAEDADFEARNRNRRVRIGTVDACSIEGSRELLRSAIDNVIRNAVNYTAEGTEVELSLERVCDSSEEHAVIRVRDHGEGVPQQALDKIFRPFYVVDEARQRSAGRVGLGLTITERAVNLHGGQVKAENSPSGGLVIELRLPLQSRCELVAQVRDM